MPRSVLLLLVAAAGCGEAAAPQSDSGPGDGGLPDAGGPDAGQRDAGVPGGEPALVLAGAFISGAIDDRGGLYLWGSNAYGQLGDGTGEDRTEPGIVADLADVIHAAVGGRHSCAVEAGGALHCFGDNLAGELGDGTTDPSPRPLLVTAVPDAVAVGVGNGFTCALRAGGGVRCFGRNEAGQLGDGTNMDRTMAVDVQMLSGAVGLAVGEHHTCALRRAGEVVCWGVDDRGQLGRGMGTGSGWSPPGAVVMLADAVQITAGAQHSCALRATGQVVCWGSRSRGQLGNGPAELWGTSPSPVTMSRVGTDGVEVAAGAYHTCVRLAAGTVSCTGRNDEGQLGNDMTMDSPEPVAVTGLADVVDISAGELHTCARQSDGVVLCWGRNDEGQLGDGTTEDRHFPRPTRRL